MKLKDMTANQLNSGSYMKKYHVIDYIEKKYSKLPAYRFKLIEKVKSLTEHVSLSGVFLSVDDIQAQVMMPDVFREMECHVVTYSLSYPENN